MFYLRLLENWALTVNAELGPSNGYVANYVVRRKYETEIYPNVGPGFINAWNRYVNPF